MQENEFEKRVQQRMEGFKLRPSDAVWQKVEEELRKKKKRRVVFFIFLLACLSLLGYTGYFFVNQSKQTIADQAFTQQTNSDSAQKSNTVDLPAAHTTTSNENRSLKQNQLAIKPDPGENSSVTEELKKENMPAIVKETRQGVKPIAGKTLHRTVVKESNAVAKKASAEKKAGNKKRDQPGNVQAGIAAGHKPAETENDGTVVDEKKNSEEIVIAEPAPANKVAPAAEAAIEPVKKDSALAELKEKEKNVAKPTKKTNAKIKWGIDFSAGLSGMRDNAFLFSNGQKNLMDQAYASPGNSGNLYMPPVLPSSTKAGPAFKLGVMAQKEITKRSSVSAGLQYAYVSTKMKIGSYWNTSLLLSNAATQSLRVSAVYRAVPQKDYTNHYHFIQLPLQYHLQLNKGKKLPLLWNVGASIGYMVSSNALVYDTAAGGIYYRDKAIFNKWQSNLHTGFSFLLGKPQKLQWSIGPEISLGMNKLEKDTYSRKQYLLYGGLSGRIIFPRKN